MVCLLSKFQHTAARRRPTPVHAFATKNKLFQHTAARRRPTLSKDKSFWLRLFQHTAARRRPTIKSFNHREQKNVSTHSRPKATEQTHGCKLPPQPSFNTQPPEGDRLIFQTMLEMEQAFQHTAARRRPIAKDRVLTAWVDVSTHSRPKATDLSFSEILLVKVVSTHSRPKATDPLSSGRGGRQDVSTHSRPKATDETSWVIATHYCVSTHSRPKATD